MGLGRTHREQIIEREHQIYLNETIHKQDNWLESEEYLMAKYKEELDKDANVITVIIGSLLITVLIIGLAIWGLCSMF
jgi:hypothetical protein